MPIRRDKGQRLTAATVFARLALLIPLALFCALFSASAAETSLATSAGSSFFEQKIRPALAEHCYKCHLIRAEDEVNEGRLFATILNAVGINHQNDKRKYS